MTTIASIRIVHYVIVLHYEFHRSGNFYCVFFSTLEQWINSFISCSSMSELLMQSWTSSLRTTEHGASFWDVNTAYGELCCVLPSLMFFVMHACALICWIHIYLFMCDLRFVIINCTNVMAK